MVSKFDLKAVFDDTRSWIESDEALSNAVKESIDKTEVYFEDDYPYFKRRFRDSLTVEVTMEKSFQAAMRLNSENPSKKLAVMNFANAFNSGGGVMHGSRAQEESLCRTSTLYPVIARPEMWNTFYAYHRELNNYKATDALIYSENIVICKTEDDIPRRMPESDWVKTDVITIAAPQLTMNQCTNGGVFVSDAELFAIHVKRAIHMLTVAASRKADILVLGAFGCGAFNNNPYIVANAYKVALEQFDKAFEKVVFAVFCTSDEAVNYKAFKEILGRD